MCEVQLSAFNSDAVYSACANDTVCASATKHVAVSSSNASLGHAVLQDLHGASEILENM